MRRATLACVSLFAVLAPFLPSAQARPHGAEAVQFRYDSMAETTWLRIGALYKFVVSGVAASPDGLVDPECVRSANGTWVRHRFGTGSSDRYDVHLNGYMVDWVPQADDGQGCSYTHTYEIVLRAIDDRSVTTGVFGGRSCAQTFYSSSCTGQYTLTVVDLRDPPAGIAVNPYEEAQHLSGVRREYIPREVREAVVVMSDDPWGVSSGQHEIRSITVTGTYNWGLGEADAECSAWGDSPDEWVPDRFKGADGRPDSDILDLVLGYNDLDVQWEPVTGPGPCDPNHTYRLQTSRLGATLRLRVLEVERGWSDNLGALQVVID